MINDKGFLMSNEYLSIEQSLGLSGEIELIGAKNAVLVIISSLILTSGKSVLKNVPGSRDVLHMIALLKDLGAQVHFDTEVNELVVDTSRVMGYKVSPEIMKKMRASVLVMGPLLARFGCVDLALPGGCSIGARPIDYHLTNFRKMGAEITVSGELVSARATQLTAQKLVLEYPSVGATENIMMAAVLTHGTTRIINAAIEPEVLDLITVLQKMGARIAILPGATIEIEGVATLNPVEHSIIPDRLEAGGLLLAAAMTGGDVYLPQAPAYFLDIFLMKLSEMGHTIEVGPNETGIRLKATKNPKAVSFKTCPYPGFPTDLQAPMMAAQCIAEGTSVVQETVYENRLLHVRELQKMGAHIMVKHDTATIMGVDELFGTTVIATDIRASCALVLAGFVAQGTTVMLGLDHWRRGYEYLEEKFAKMGGKIALLEGELPPTLTLDPALMAKRIRV
jgi:UDP-N-acetylglucosamine 1-carboxyvinyltransferase